MIPCHPHSSETKIIKCKLKYFCLLKLQPSPTSSNVEYFKTLNSFNMAMGTIQDIGARSNSIYNMDSMEKLLNSWIIYPQKVL